MEKSFFKNYSLTDISRQIHRPRTTVNEWASIFHEYLPVVGEGRTKRYKQESLEIFDLVARMKDAQEPNEMIFQTLRDTCKEITVRIDDGLQLEVSRRLMSSYYELTSEVRRQNDIIESLVNRIDELSAANMKTLEAIASPRSAKHKQSWIRKLFG